MIHFDLEKKQERILYLESLSNQEDFWKDKKNSKKVIFEINHLKRLLNDYFSLSKNVESLLQEIISLEKETDFELLELISEEYIKTVQQFKDFEIKTLLSGPYDSNDAILEFHPGAGGTESQDWANMVYEMYHKWALKKNYKLEVLDYQLGEEAGIKSASILIHGENAYGYLKNESGVHRLVRISPFDANKRRHTSFMSVEVIPDFEDNDEIIINESDLKIDTYRASGAGGQHINKTDSAVRMTHIPSGIVVSCQSQRSQIQNKEKCLLMIKSKLYALMLKQKEEELAKLKGVVKANEWGSQIRSYVLCPYTLVKDHRSNYEESNAASVLDGNIDEFIFSNLKQAIVEEGK